VVAKRTSRAGGDLERRVHEQVLPRLALRTLAFHGAVAEDDGLWLFLEDAGGESTLGPEDRRLLAAWLARLHTSAAPLCAGLDLPVRGADQHRERLRAACRALRDRVANPALLPADRWVLRELAGALERLDARWDAVEALCAQMPRTLVHGDLGPQNVRLRRTAGGAEILALDWETASVGPPAVDLVGVDPAVYAKVASREWPGATPQAVAGWKRCGALLRAITAIGWELPDLASPWVETPMARLRVYRQEIQEALAELASGVGAVAAPGAMR
jgi:aminoglycoside phosphotransferase (APT) family kinase protein